MASTRRSQAGVVGDRRDVAVRNWLVVGRNDGGVSILHAKPRGYDLRLTGLAEGCQRLARQRDRPVFQQDGGLHVL